MDSCSFHIEFFFTYFDILFCYFSIYNNNFSPFLHFYNYLLYNKSPLCFLPFLPFLPFYTTIDFFTLLYNYTHLFYHVLLFAIIVFFPLYKLTSSLLVVGGVVGAVDVIVVSPPILYTCICAIG